MCFATADQGDEGSANEIVTLGSLNYIDDVRAAQEWAPIQDLNRSQAMASSVTYKNKWCKTGIYFYKLLFILRLLLISHVISLALGKRLKEVFLNCNWLLHSYFAKLHLNICTYIYSRRSQLGKIDYIFKCDKILLNLR